ncbi:MAG TPA: FkbM family methyltransferase [Anaeromyxobacteraceae bacterium]|nr:FkbM family methyltransferase [Anaeromyxobacteraceae bacterium]
MTTANTFTDAQRAAALLQSAALLLEVGESGIALAGLERAESLESQVPQIKRARAIALAQMNRPLEAARTLMEELALAPDDGDAFRTFLGMMDRVPQIRALPAGTFFRQLLTRLDRAVERRYQGRGYGTTLQRAAKYAALVLGHAPAFEATFASLGDDASRDCMLEVASLVALGDERVRLPFDEEGLEEFRTRSKESLLLEEGGDLGLYDLRPAGIPLRVITTERSLASWAYLGQYALDREGAHVGPERGDVVIDGGGALGDSALWFAHRAGGSGRVVSFEFEPAHLTVFRENLSLNPSLAGRVEIVPEALRARSESGGSAPARSIDDFVEASGLERVDFVKLDIDGAEKDALAGAERTLRRFRPRLAIAVHFRPEDIGVTPAHVLGLGLGYRVFLGQYAPGAWETTLFATAD